MYIKDYIKEERKHIFLSIATLLVLFTAFKINSILLFGIVVLVRLCSFIDYFQSIRKSIININLFYKRDKIDLINDYKLGDIWSNNRPIFIDYENLNKLDNVRVNKFIGEIYASFPVIDLVTYLLILLKYENITKTYSIFVGLIISFFIVIVCVMVYIMHEELLNLQLYKRYENSKRDYYTRNYKKLKGCEISSGTD